MAQAKEGDAVKVHYTGTLDDGTVFDSSREREPLEFTIGERRLIPAFEDAVVGMSPGDRRSTRIAAEDAYGPYQDEMVATVERAVLPAHLAPSVGDRLVARSADGDDTVLTVTGMDESTVTLDGNHPLAGQDLLFEIELVDLL